ncbi:MAG TPA: hypothetical protein VOA78_10885 [Candidatus Dormibacteraeota bacterium]|nr:hypothetical protein [Candidatus Dormibacteraeota bacterium]
MTNQAISSLSPSQFFRQHFLVILAISLLLVIPCFWHRHIQAGDLPSHLYNAWLAQLITQGQAPGLYLAHRYDNVLFDLALFHTANLFGLPAAEKIVVSLAVLTFFWGVFSFVHAVSQRPPWFLAPAIATLAYAYAFNMGFFNYYLSIGLACFSLAFAWRAKAGNRAGNRAGNWLLAFLIAPLVLLAHPMGFLWLLGTLAYSVLRQSLPGWWKLLLPTSAAAAFFALHWYFAHRATFPVDWEAPPIYLLTGADQLILYGDRYVTLSWAALAFGILCVAAEFLRPSSANDPASWKKFLPALELYAVSFIATALLPENLRPPGNSGWIGLIVSRLTAITAIFGLCLLAQLHPRKWHLAGFAALAAIFFSFLYQDTAWLNRLEFSADSLLAPLPYGTRIIPTIAAPPDWRITFIGHLADRACIHHCFTYSNYEAPSQQFRVRTSPQGSPLVTSSEDDAEDMEGGSYEIQATDLPLLHLYQCDPRHPTDLCLRPLHEGDTTSFSPTPTPH